MDVGIWMDGEIDAYLPQPAPPDYFDESVGIGLYELARVLEQKRVVEAIHPAGEERCPTSEPTH